MRHTPRAGPVATVRADERTKPTIMTRTTVFYVTARVLYTQETRLFLKGARNFQLARF